MLRRSRELDRFRRSVCRLWHPVAMKLGFRLHGEHDHPELDGRTGHEFRLWLNRHMMTNHLERPSLTGTEDRARQRHSDLHAEMAKRASEWAAAHGVKEPVPGSRDAKTFEMTMKPVRTKSTAKSKKTKSKKSMSAKVALRKSVKVKGPRIRVVSGGAPGLGKKR